MVSLMVLAPLPDKPLFTIPEAAHYLGVARWTIYRWLQSGELIGNGARYFVRITHASIQKKLSQLSQPFYDE